MKREHVFERFFRGRAAHDRGIARGTGLGLALVRDHVRAFGGTITVSERPRRGRPISDSAAHRAKRAAVRRLRTLLGLVLGALALAGCTMVPTASSPQVIGPQHVPFGLLGKTIPGTNNGRVTLHLQPVYIVTLPVTSPRRADCALARCSLGAAPAHHRTTTIESGGGYTSALPKNLIILSASFRGEIGYIDLGSTLNKFAAWPGGSSPWANWLDRADVGLTLGIQIKGVEITVAGVTQDSPIPTGAKPSS